MAIWSTSVAALDWVGVVPACKCDGSQIYTVDVVPAFVEQCINVQLSIGANYTGSDNAAIMPRLTSEPGLGSFSFIVNGGQSGTSVDVHYRVLGT